MIIATICIAPKWTKSKTSNTRMLVVPNWVAYDWDVIIKWDKLGWVINLEKLGRKEMTLHIALIWLRGLMN